MTPEVRQRSVKLRLLVEVALDLRVNPQSDQDRERILEVARLRHNKAIGASDETWMYVQAALMGVESHLQNQDRLASDGARRRGW